jgi:hypothetical protein
MVWTVLGITGWLGFGVVSVWSFASMMYSQEKRRRLANYASMLLSDDELRSHDNHRLREFCDKRIMEGFQKPLMEAVMHDRFVQALADEFWDREKARMAEARRARQ